MNFLEIESVKRVIDQTGYKIFNSLKFLHEVINNIKPNLILEFGTGFGCSSIIMALATDGMIITVDDYRGDTTKDISIVIDNLISCNVKDKVTPIISNTQIDARQYLMPDKKPEIVFMDASHNYADLIKEYEAIRPVLEGDHILIIDDVNSMGTFPFIEDLFDEDLSMAGKRYESCSIYRFHEGMAILSTNDKKYLAHITDASLKSI